MNQKTKFYNRIKKHLGETYKKWRFRKDDILTTFVSKITLTLHDNWSILWKISKRGTTRFYTSLLFSKPSLGDKSFPYNKHLRKNDFAPVFCACFAGPMMDLLDSPGGDTWFVQAVSKPSPMSRFLLSMCYMIGTILGATLQPMFLI